MFHVLEQPQLPVGSLGVDDGLEGPGQFLHRHSQTSLGVKGRTATESSQIILINFLLMHQIHTDSRQSYLDTELQAISYLQWKLFLGILVHDLHATQNPHIFTQLLVSAENV